MSALAVTTAPIRPAAPRAAKPDCSRPRDVAFRAHRARVASCSASRPSSEPVLELTRRGMAVAVSLVGLVMGSAVVTLVTAFLSVSNAPF